VGGGHPHAAVRRRFDGAQPAEGLDEELLDVGDAVTADHLAVQPHTALAGDVDDVADHGQATARAGRDRIGVYRLDEARRTAAATALRGRTLARRPAVVAALLDEVGLVHDAVAELLLPQPALGVEVEALRVAVAVAPDVLARERVVRRHAAVRVQPQDLAVEAVEVLGVGTALGVTGGGVQLAVRAPAQPATVVERVALDAGQQDLLGARLQRVARR